jgi:TolA-binding protein
MRLGSRVLLLLAVGILGGGCADLMVSDSLSQDVAQLQQDVSQLKLNVQRGRMDSEAIGRLDRASREQATETSRQLAALSARVENLNAEMSRLTARLDQVTQRLEARARDARAEPPSARRVEPSAPTAAPPSAAPVAPPTPVPARPATDSGTRSTEVGSVEERYQAAYQDFSKGHYALAIPALRDYVRQFPDSPLADSAQCAVGESYLGLARASATAGQPDKARQETEQAVQEFRKVLANYPRGSKAPTALYKEAVALTELQQTALAQARLRYLLDHFPQSEEAPLAKERLAALSR